MLCLTQIATTEPQAAFTAFTKSIQAKWAFVQRVVPDCQSWFSDLEDLICDQFLPTVLGGDVTKSDRVLFSLPARWGGLGVRIPTTTGNDEFTISRKATNEIVTAIKHGFSFEPEAHDEMMRETKQSAYKDKEMRHNDVFLRVMKDFSTLQGRAILRSKGEKNSGWLTSIPSRKNQTDLSAQEFRDALAIRYRRPLLNTPEMCDGCGALFNLSHALSCRKGGLVIRRHNEVRDAFGDLASMLWHQVRCEPVVKESDDESPALVADLAVRGVWLPQAEALFDIRVIDTDAQSYGNRSPRDVIKSAENEKKAKYTRACEERRAQFTPLCISVDGVLGSEAEVFVKRVADGLSRKWEKKYSEVIGWIRTRLCFAVLRATILCLRGSRTKWRSLRVEDGAALDLMSC